MASKKRDYSDQFTLTAIISADKVERPVKITNVSQLKGVPNNEYEPVIPVRHYDRDPDTVSVAYNGGELRPYTVSYVRYNGTHFGSMCLTLTQLKQLIAKSCDIIGLIAVDLDELDDYSNGE